MKRRLSDGTIVDFTAAEITAHDTEVTAIYVAQRAQLKVDVKTEANTRIVALYPEWKQINMLAEMSNLHTKGKANWNAADDARDVEVQAVWVEVGLIRTNSNTIEAEIDGLTDAQLDTFDIPGNATWDAI
jgi:hypothetical protein